MFKYRCELIPNYKFDACIIDTCKNFSPILTSKCMLVERTDCLNDDKGMSDHEIKYFKNYADVKSVTKQKKLAFDSVYSLLIFDKFWEYCGSLPTRNYDQSLLLHKTIKNVVSNYPFNLKEFRLNLSILSYLTSKDVYNSFSIKTDCKMCSEYDISDVLNLSTASIRTLTKIFELQELPHGSTKSS